MRGTGISHAAPDDISSGGDGRPRPAVALTDCRVLD